MSSLPVVRPVSMRHNIAQVLAQSLREGQFRLGEDLSEQQLATQMEVSRGPVREALLVLAQDGLLTHVPNRGFSVLDFRAEDRAAIELIRLPLETIALTLARGRFSSTEIQELRRLKGEIIRLFGERNPERDNTELTFHGMIWAKSGNRWLENSLTRIMIPYFTYSRFLPNIPPADLTMQMVSDQHQCFLDYINGECNLTAEECVRFHLRLSK